jgi:Domain of unknown function (DUF6484)
VKKNDDSLALAERPIVAGIVTGKLVGFAQSGEPLINTGGDDAARGLRARTCVVLRTSDVGKTVVLAFDSADPSEPIVLGVIQSDQHERAQEVEVDGKTIVVTSQETLVLQCGDASITLSHDGKVVIRGQHVVSHASGVNRIRGGSVQLN